jgi:hypothetical protein
MASQSKWASNWASGNDRRGKIRPKLLIRKRKFSDLEQYDIVLL